MTFPSGIGTGTTGATTAAPRTAHNLHWPLSRSDQWTLLIGAILTTLIALAAVREGAIFGLGPMVVALVFLACLAAWIVVPHLAVAAAIPLFVFIPAGKILITPWIGPVKDIAVLAAVGAIVVGMHPSRRRGTPPLDKPLLLLVAVTLGLYFVDLGGVLAGAHHGLPWAHGLRLVSEPLILLVAGLTLPWPERTLNLAAGSVVVTGCAVAGVGIFQQFIGAPALITLGYSYEEHVRTIGGSLRSFGTFDEPFSYAAFLLIAIATVMFWMRPGGWAVFCLGLLSVGLIASYVRTGIGISVALIALWLIRSRRTTAGAVLLAISGIAALTLLFADPGANETRTERADSQTYITLNGRTTVWKAIFGDSRDLPFGLGVGEVGTAAERAEYGVSIAPSEKDSKAVDSGYFAAVADVGLVGLVALLALLGRLVLLGVRGTRVPGNVGWLVLAWLTVLLLDAVARSSFTAFPTAFLVLLLVGVGVALILEREKREPAWGAGG